MKVKRLRFLGILLLFSVCIIVATRYISAVTQTNRDMKSIEVFKVKNISMVNDSKDGNSLLQAVDVSNNNRLLEISIRKPKKTHKKITHVYLYKNEMATVDYIQLKHLRFDKHYNLIASFGLLLKTIMFVVLSDIIIVWIWAFILLKRQELRYKKNKHITN